MFILQLLTFSFEKTNSLYLILQIQFYIHTKLLKSQIKGWIFMPVLIKEVEEKVKCKASKILSEPVRE